LDKFQLHVRLGKLTNFGFRAMIAAFTEFTMGAQGSIAVKALSYKPEGSGFKTR
jgi:hypothetical protein